MTYGTGRRFLRCKILSLVKITVFYHEDNTFNVSIYFFIYFILFYKVYLIIQ